MLFKKRWIYKAISWKVLSAILGALVVLTLTGNYSMSWGYLVLYVPISLVLFIGHEYVWTKIKYRLREKHTVDSSCKHCNGSGVRRYSDGSPYLCLACDGTGVSSGNI